MCSLYSRSIATDFSEVISVRWTYIEYCQRGSELRPGERALLGRRVFKLSFKWHCCNDSCFRELHSAADRIYLHLETRNVNANTITAICFYRASRSSTNSSRIKWLEIRRKPVSALSVASRPKFGRTFHFDQGSEVRCHNLTIRAYGFRPQLFPEAKCHLCLRTCRSLTSPLSAHLWLICYVTACILWLSHDFLIASSNRAFQSVHTFIPGIGTVSTGTFSVHIIVTPNSISTTAIVRLDK